MLLIGCKRPNTTNIKISGEVLNLNNTIVLLKQNGYVVDSTFVENDKFSLQGNVWNNKLCSIVFKSTEPTLINNERMMWLHPIDIFVEDEADYLIKANGPIDILHNNYEILTNSIAQNQFSSYILLYKKNEKLIKNKIKYLSLKQDSALLLRDNELYTMYTDSLRINEKALSQLNLKLLHQTVINPNSYLAVYLLAEAPDIYKNKAFYTYVHQKLEGKYLNHPYGEMFSKRLKRVEKMDAGNINLKVKAKDFLSNQFKYSDFAHSKLIVFDFWATWCTPCLSEMPSALKFQRESINEGVSYIFLSFDTNVMLWKEQSKMLGLKNSYLINKEDRDSLDNQLDISTIPRYVILDNKGNVLVNDAPSPNSIKLKELMKGLLKNSLSNSK